jgi:hypothetical protein
MADAVEAGKVRAVGVSNYSAAQLRVAHAALAERGIPLAANQVEYSLLHRAPEVNGVLDACRELGITLIAYQPLAMGALTGKYRPGDRPRGIRRFDRSFRRDGLEKVQPVVALLGEIGEGYSKTLRRWRCGGSSNRRVCCRSPVRRTGGKRPAMPKRFPSRWLVQRSRRSTKQRRRGGDEVIRVTTATG